MLYLHCQYHLGAIRIMWYMKRYHAITISEVTCPLQLIHLAFKNFP